MGRLRSLPGGRQPSPTPPTGCLRCGSTLGVRCVDGVGWICAACASRALDCILDEESRIWDAFIDDTTWRWPEE